MWLFVLPGACSLASHIAVEWIREQSPQSAAAQCDVVVIERGKNFDAGYLAINPLGTVPALVTCDGRLIVESLAVLLHLAGYAQGDGLAPSPGTPDYDRLLTLLSAMVTSAHPAFQMLWRSERFADTTDAAQAVERAARARLGIILARLNGEIGDRRFLVGDHVTVADFYLFVIGRWSLRLHETTDAYPNLWRFTKSVASLPAVTAAMRTEGISLEGPKTGLG